MPGTSLPICNYIVPQSFFDRPATFTSLVKLFSEPQYLTSTQKEEDPLAGITEIDYEEQSAGYQAAYSKLAASESVEVDPVAYIRDPQQYLGEQLVSLSKSQGQQLKAMLSAADPATVRPFVQALSAAGYVL
jgi:exportin-2 (importin alpha re-exporter)